MESSQIFYSILGHFLPHETTSPMNTIAGAGIGVVAAATAFKITKSPLLVGIAALTGAYFAYRGAHYDLQTPDFF